MTTSPVSTLAVRASDNDTTDRYLFGDGAAIDTAATIQSEAAAGVEEIESYIYNKVEKLRFRIKGRKDNVICSGGIKIQIEPYKACKHPVAVEEIRADAGLDIGGTLIGMHLKKVAVNIRSYLK